MPLIKCPDCSTQVSDQANACPSCGYPIAKKVADDAAKDFGYVDYTRRARSSPAFQTGTVVKLAKSRGVYIILGLFFGCLGIHNFYAGYYGKGALQLIITLALGWLIIGLVITGLWALIEICTVTVTADGDKMT